MKVLNADDLVTWYNQNNMNQKGFINIILAGVVVIAVAIGGYFVLGRVSKTTTPLTVTTSTTTTTTTVDTSNSKTYINSKYGFEFKYPENRIYKEIDGVDGKGVKYFMVAVDTEENINFKCEACDGPATFFRVHPYIPKVNPLETNCFQPPQGEISKITIDGISGYKCIADGLNSPNLLIYLTKDGVTYYEISADNYTGEQKVLIDKILTTFKSTESTVPPELTRETVLQVLGYILLDNICSSERVVEKYASCNMDIQKTNDPFASGVTVIYDGLYDDSVKATKLQVNMRYMNGGWTDRFLYETQQCWLGRGHQDFSSVKCL